MQITQIIVSLSVEECGVSCGPEKFACANGCCIDKALECDQVTQCTDGSDEEQCANSRYQDSSCPPESVFLAA